MPRYASISNACIPKLYLGIKLSDFEAKNENSLAVFMYTEQNICKVNNEVSNLKSG